MLWSRKVLYWYYHILLRAFCQTRVNTSWPISWSLTSFLIWTIWTTNFSRLKDIGWKSILSFIMILGAGSADRDLCCIMYTHMLCWGMPKMPLAQECAMYYSELRVSHKHKQGGEWSRQEVQSVRSSDQDQITRLGLQNCIVQNSKHCITDLSH